MSNKSSLLTAFNDHFFEFIEDILRVFPDDKDILLAKNCLLFIRKANPKLIHNVWTIDVIGKYKSQIQEGNIDFFIHKDYSDDIKPDQYQKQIMDSIDRLRSSVASMEKENMDKIIKYMQNLTKLSDLYNSM